LGALRTHDPDRCRARGYNVTANASGICPECGTRVPAEAKV